MPRDHDDRQIGVGLLDLGQHLQAIAPGHLDVQQDDRDVAGLELGEPVVAILGLGGAVLLVAQREGQLFPDGSLIVDDENAGFGGHGG